MAEDPTLEEPKVEEPAVEESNVDNAIEVARKLAELGIDNVDKVDGTVKAAQEAGRLANMLGEERRRAAELEAQLRNTREQRVDLESDDYGVDLEKVVKKGIRDFWNETQREVQQNQQRQFQEFQKIRSHKNYALVGKEFEEYTKTPDYQADLMAGKTPSEIFYDMSNDTMRNHLITLRDALLKGTKSPAEVDVPHTETTQAAPPQAEPDNEKADKLKTLKKNWKGDDSDIAKALEVLL